MLKRTLLTAIAALYIFNCHGQSTDSLNIKKDSLDEKNLHFYSGKPNFYFGVQINQLLKEIINLNTSSSALNNPYLFIASVNLSRSGWGINGGFGFDYQDVTDELSQSAKASKVNNTFYRVGIGRRTMISKRFEIGYGFDYIGNYQLNQITTTSVTTIGSTQDSTVSVTTNKTTMEGFGLQLTLGFHISERILISTETTAYYSKSKVQSNVLLTDYFTNSLNPSSDSITMSNNNTDHTQKDGVLTLPVALFLTIKF